MTKYFVLLSVSLALSATNAYSSACETFVDSKTYKTASSCLAEMTKVAKDKYGDITKVPKGKMLVALKALGVAVRNENNFKANSNNAVMFTRDYLEEAAAAPATPAPAPAAPAAAPTPASGGTKWQRPSTVQAAAPSCDIKPVKDSAKTCFAKLNAVWEKEKGNTESRTYKPLSTALKAMNAAAASCDGPRDVNCPERTKVAKSAYDTYVAASTNAATSSKTPGKTANVPKMGSSRKPAGK